ncbi:MAG: MATE family efflux transporter [Endozoicomonas sp.]
MVELQKLFLHIDTVTTLAAFTIVGYIQAVYYMIAEGIANGIQLIVSFNRSAGNNFNIRSAIRLGSVVTLGLGTDSVALINLFPDTTAWVFNRDNAPLMPETVLGLKPHLITVFLDGFIVVIAAYFQALAKPRTEPQPSLPWAIWWFKSPSY